jgi:prevent-host-death family protein
MSQSILSLSEFKADASRLLDKVRDEPGTLVLTQNVRARVVVEDYDQYQARERALSMLKLMAQGEGDVADGRLLAMAVLDGRRELRSLLLERLVRS